ncbi:cytochrome c oxidase assembly protein [Desertibaculum subflavum]|uniref:cytochrome c oxidase assembly protein n=1 Tax=Desertibaculum subflavum TaxID=2268458 RepID=UPI0034D31BC3
MFAATPPVGPLAQHMALHVLTMNLVAPLIALGLLRIPGFADPGKLLFGASSLIIATVLQLALLWGWHAPAALAAALGDHALHAAMQLSLFAAALWFWLAVVAQKAARRWLAIGALLLTGKLFCLLGVLLIFTPRLLYPGIGAPHGATDLADQQLAGLLMVAACPATYVLAGIVIAWRWLAELGLAEARPG